MYLPYSEAIKKEKTERPIYVPQHPALFDYSEAKSMKERFASFKASIKSKFKKKKKKKAEVSPKVSPKKKLIKALNKHENEIKCLYSLMKDKKNKDGKGYFRCTEIPEEQQKAAKKLNDMFKGENKIFASSMIIDSVSTRKDALEALIEICKGCGTCMKGFPKMAKELEELKNLLYP